MGTGAITRALTPPRSLRAHSHKKLYPRYTTAPHAKPIPATDRAIARSSSCPCAAEVRRVGEGVALEVVGASVMVAVVGGGRTTVSTRVEVPGSVRTVVGTREVLVRIETEGVAVVVVVLTGRGIETLEVGVGVLLVVVADEIEEASLNELFRVSDSTATTVEVELVVVSVLAAIVAVDSGCKVSEDTF